MNLLEEIDQEVAMNESGLSKYNPRDREFDNSPSVRGSGFAIVFDREAKDLQVFTDEFFEIPEFVKITNQYDGFGSQSVARILKSKVGLRGRTLSMMIGPAWTVFFDTHIAPRVDLSALARMS